MYYQQFSATIVTKEGEVKAFHPHSYNSKSKLMLQSYISNPYVSIVLNQLKRGDRLYWLGEYANYEELHNKDLKISEDEWDNVYEVWYNLNKFVYIEDENYERQRYVINLTKKCYIDLDDSRAFGINTECKEINYFHPIPLLCSVGNGNTYGDYYGVNSELCGAWAGDEIIVSNDEKDIKGLYNYTHDVWFRYDETQNCEVF